MNKSIYILNGPNLNRLGQARAGDLRQDHARRYRDRIAARKRGSQPIEFRQTNSEAQLIDWIHEAIDKGSGHHHQPRGLSPSPRSRSSTR